MGMNGTAFIRMMREDLETDKNRKEHEPVVEVMEYVIGQHPGCEVDPSKNAEDCFKEIEKAAQKIFEKKTKGISAERLMAKDAKPVSVLIGHDEAIAIVSEYLGITQGDGTGSAPLQGAISLEDFL